MKDLTVRQQQVLLCIERAIAANGFSPSIREVGHALGINSSSTISYHIWALTRKGYITFDPRKPRTIRILGKGTQGVSAAGPEAVPGSTRSEAPAAGAS